MAVNLKKSELLKTHGVEGTTLYGGRIGEPLVTSEILSDDYLADWTYSTVTKMRRSDGMVAALLRAVSLMIRGADWEVRAASDEPGDLEIAAFVEENLWRVWDGFISQALLYLPYGFMLFEVLWEARDWKPEGKAARQALQWKRLAPRMPWTVDQWGMEEGTLAKVVQLAQADTGGWKPHEIPAGKVLRLTNEQEGSNFEGTSILRPGYKHWRIKDVLYKISAIKHERWGVGIPVGSLPAEASPETEKEFIKALRELRANEAAHLYLGRGVDIAKAFTIMVPGGGQAGTSDLLDHIRHHDVLLARSVLAEFLCLGETTYGSRAVGDSQMALFLMSLQSVADYVAAVVNKGHPGEAGGIRQLVNLNFGPDAPAPELVCTRVDRQDNQALATALAQLVQAGAVAPDRDLDNWGRSLVGAPPLPEKPAEGAQANERAHAHGMTLADPETAKGATTAGPDGGPEGYWRELHEWEKHVDFAEYEERHADFEARFVEAWEELLSAQVAAMRDELGPTVDREDLPRLQAMQLPGGAKFTDRIVQILIAAHAHGRESVYRELMGQLRVKRIPPVMLDEAELKAMEILRAQALAAARHLGERIRHAAERFLLARLARRQEVPLPEVEEELALLSETEAKLEAYASIRPAWGMGRDDSTEVFDELVERGYYSAILDGKECEVCHLDDGREVDKGAYATPNPDCYGGSRCRCITIWILKDEVGPRDVASAWYRARG